MTQAALEAALELFVEHLGAEHWQVGNTMNNLRSVAELDGRYEAALAYFDQGVPILDP